MRQIYNTSELEVGDQVSVERRVDGWTSYPMTVAMIINDGSKARADSRTVTVSRGPGRYSVTFDNMHLRNDLIRIFKKD